MPQVVVTLEQHCLAPPDVVWEVVATPEVSSGLDPRVTLLEARGAAGAVGSSYDLDVRVGGRTIHQRVEVVESEHPRLLRARTTPSKGRPAEQLAELQGDGEETVLRWTLLLSTPPLLGRLSAVGARAELTPWLQRVAAEAERRTGA